MGWAIGAIFLPQIGRLRRRNVGFTSRSHRQLARHTLRACLAPKDLLHESLELCVGDAAGRRRLHLAEHGLQLLVRQVLAFAAEALLEVRLRNEPSIVNVEVMEGESQVGLSNGLSAINSDRKELAVIDLAIVIEVDSFEDLVDFCFTHVKLIESRSDLAELQRARIVGVERAESIA